jgi:tRNA dimethylallyltransferase
MTDTQGVRRAVLIAGPTASGKSALALELAARCGGVIVNADSMQVYRDLRVVTARPSAAEEARAPHRLYGHVDAAESFSAGRWLADVAAAFAQAEAAGLLPIVVGGTGLYFKLLTTGIAAVPPIPPAIRTALRRRLAAEDAPALHAELARRDPVSAARLSARDRTRIVRALEVIEATGRPLRAWHGDNAAPLVASDGAVKLFLAPDRAALRARIEARFDAMLAAGALDEVRALAGRGLDPLLPAMKAHGVPGLIRHLRGEIGLDEAAAQAKADTRRYAKRQFTWFRNQLADWPWAAPETALDSLLAQLGA